MSIFIPNGSTLAEVEAAKEAGFYLPSVLEATVSGMIVCPLTCCAPGPGPANTAYLVLSWPNPNGMTYNLSRVSGQCSLWRADIGAWSGRTYGGGACTGSFLTPTGDDARVFLDYEILTGGTRVWMHAWTKLFNAFLATRAEAECSFCDGPWTLVYTNSLTTCCEPQPPFQPTGGIHPYTDGAITIEAP